MTSFRNVVSVPVVADEGVQPTPAQVDVVGVGIGIRVRFEGEPDEDEQQARAELLAADFAPKERLCICVSCLT